MIVKLEGDNKCSCTMAEPCPIGQTGRYHRCTKDMLQEAGIFTTRADFDGTYPGPPEGKVMKLCSKRDGQKADKEK